MVVAVESVVGVRRAGRDEDGSNEVSPGLRVIGWGASTLKVAGYG
tara:strand:+ start:1044 stop:1178 length:135 start_codon:yes stop_codon:yes gene_type:complete